MHPRELSQGGVIQAFTRGFTKQGRSIAGCLDFGGSQEIARLGTIWFSDLDV